MAVGTKERTVTCNPTNIMMGDTFRWFFTNTTTENGMVITNPDKYNISGQMNQTLTVRNIELKDEGLYFCRTIRSGAVLGAPLPGACLYAYSKSKLYFLNM